MAKLIARKGDITIECDTVEQMEAISEILNKMPNRFLFRLGKMYISGHGKEVTVILVTLATILLAVGTNFSRKRIKKFIIKRIAPLLDAAERKLGLPWAPPAEVDVEEVDFEEVPENESCEEDEQPEKEEAPKRKPWTERCQDEFGPIPELPPMLQFVVERCPAGYEVAMTVTLLCAFAALCFSKVRAKYLDGKVHAPNLQVLVEANWGVGKDKFMTALNALFKRLFDRDKEKYSSEDKGKIIQWAGISATESKFIDILANNGEVHVLMVSSEILAAVNNMRKKNGLTAEYFRKAFDNGEVYRANKTKDIQGLFRVFMNCILTGTPGDTEKFFSKELEGGTASRFCLLAIPDSGRYLEALIIEDGEELEKYRDQIDEWNRLYCYNHDELSGCDIPAEEHFIELDYVNAAIETWISDDQWNKANGDPSDPRVGARGRMGAIAFHCAMVIHMLFGCPGPDMLQTRRKVVNLTIYIANYCMERFLLKFGAIQKVQRELNNLAETVDTPTVNQGTQHSSLQPDEENYSGSLSKSTVIEMVKYYDLSEEIGYTTVAKKFGLPPGEASRKMVSRAIRKLKKEQQGK
jgi:hypothetical protein